MLSEIGARWANDEDEDRMVLAKLRAMVSRILEEFVDDISLFDELYQEIADFAESLHERARRIEKRQEESQKGMERLAGARQQARNEVHSRIESLTLPKGVLKLLREPWTDFLAYLFLRHGTESAIWRSSLKVADGVIWSVTSKRLGEDEARFNDRAS